MEKVIEEKLDQILYAIEDFLSINSEYYIEDIKVVYMTPWQKGNKKMYARGAVKLGDAYFPVQLTYNTYTKKLILRSPIFLFKLSLQDVEEFLSQAAKNGDNA